MEKLGFDEPRKKRPVYGWLCRECNFTFLERMQLPKRSHPKGMRISYVHIPDDADEKYFTRKPSCRNCGGEDVVKNDIIYRRLIAEQRKLEELKMTNKKEKTEKAIRNLAIIIVVIFWLAYIYYEY